MKSKSFLASLFILISISIAAISSNTQTAVAQSQENYTFSYSGSSVVADRIPGGVGLVQISLSRVPEPNAIPTETSYINLSGVGSYPQIRINGCAPATGTYFETSNAGGETVSLQNPESENTYGCSTQQGTGEIRATLRISNLDDIDEADYPNYSPIEFIVYDTSGNTLSTTDIGDLTPGMVADGFITGTLNDVPPGTDYIVEYRLGGNAVATTTGLDVVADAPTITGETITLDQLQSAVAGNLGEPGVTCESEGPSLGWIFCPIIVGLDGATSVIYSVVRNELALFTDPVTGEVDDCGGDTRVICTDSDSQVYKMWQGFRNLARSLMVVALMVIIYAQLVGTSVVDAYNVRRMLPKFVIAVIGVELSWFVFSEFAILVEDISRGIPDLILSVTGIEAGASLPIQVDESWAGGLAVAATGVFVLYAIAVPSFMLGLLPILLSIFLALLVGFIILVLRRLILVSLLILAPVALVLWVIPGTEKMFGRWFQAYQNLLFMYPLIMLLISAGIVLSQVSGEVQIDGGMSLADTILVLTAMIAYFAPYFLIPLTFKWAGGAMASVAGMVNDRSKGILDRTKNAVGEKQKTMRDFQRQQARNQQINNNGKLGNPLNRIRSGRLTPPLFKEGSTALQRKGEDVEALKWEATRERAFKAGNIEHQQNLLKSAQEEEDLKVSTFSLTEAIKSLDYGSANDHLDERMRNGDDIEQIAASRLLAKRGDPGVEKIREFVESEFDAKIDATIAKGSTATSAELAEAKRLDTARTKFVTANFGDLDGVAPEITRSRRDLLDFTAPDPSQLRARDADLMSRMKDEPQKVAGYGGGSFKRLADKTIVDSGTAVEFSNSVTQIINSRPENLSVDQAENMLKSFYSRLGSDEFKNGLSTDPSARAAQEQAITQAISQAQSAYSTFAQGKQVPIRVEPPDIT